MSKLRPETEIGPCHYASFEGRIWMGHTLCFEYLPSISSANPMSPSPLGTILSFPRVKYKATLCPLQASLLKCPSHLLPSSLKGQLSRAALPGLY